MIVPHDRIDALVNELDIEGSPGGIIGVAHRGELVYSRPFGLANLEYQLPVTRETSFHIASLSKHFAAYAIALLAHRGELSLDARLQDFFPDLPDFAKQVTLRHLLHHTSGIRDQWYVLMLAGWRLDDVITTRDVMRGIRNQHSLNAAPGEEYNYTNAGYTLLGEIVEIVTGDTLRRFCHKHMFEPLGMLSTHFHDDYTEPVLGRSYSYRRENPGAAWRNAVLSYGTVGASSLHTTLGDLVRWAVNFGDDVVGGEGTQELMHEHGVLNDGTAIPYCLGLVADEIRGVKRVHHAGGDAGFSSDMVRFPDHDIAIIALSNSGDLGRAPVLSEHVQQLILDELGAPKVSNTGTWNEPNPESFVGRYIHDSTGLTVDIVDDDSGVLQFASADSSRPLDPDADGVSSLGILLEVRLAKENDMRFVETFNYSDSRMRYRPVAPNQNFVAELPNLVGLYFADELDALCRIDLVDGKLSFSDRSASASALNHVEGPAHEVVLQHPNGQWPGAIIFDESSDVPAFWFSFPRARRIRYERIAP